MENKYQDIPPTQDWTKLVKQRCTEFSLLPIPVLQALLKRLIDAHIVSLPTDVELKELNLENLCEILSDVFIQSDTERKELRDKSLAFSKTLTDHDQLTKVVLNSLSQGEFDSLLNQTALALQYLNSSEQHCTKGC